MARRCFHSYASRIGSKAKTSEGYWDDIHVSIHTLHELEARLRPKAHRRYSDVSIHTLHELEASDPYSPQQKPHIEFPFIRFTNWKQGLNLPQCPRQNVRRVSIHTLHELEARICFVFLPDGTKQRVSIHTLHELEASLLIGSAAGVMLWESFHSYASRIGSKWNYDLCC